MKKTLLLAAFGTFLTAFLVLGAGLSASYAMGSSGSDDSSVYYVCGCGADCKCNSMSKDAGKCTCGKEMVQMHLLEIRDGKALFCTCGGDCTCKLSADDPTKCGCGKPVKVVDLKGKYICGCGPDCKCGTISDSPGKCKCGKDMMMVE